jgi:hypothetical protein
MMYLYQKTNEDTTHEPFTMRSSSIVLLLVEEISISNSDLNPFEILHM